MVDCKKAFRQFLFTGGLTLTLIAANQLVMPMLGSATTYTIQTNGDAILNYDHTVSGTFYDRSINNYGGGTFISVNRGGTITNCQKAYIRFEHSSIGVAAANNIKLQFYMIPYASTSVPANEGASVYGFNGSQSSNDWDEGIKNGSAASGSEICWDNAPGNAIAGYTVTADCSTLGKVVLPTQDKLYTLSGSNLDNYIKNLSGTKAAFILCGSASGVSNVRLASKENTSGYPAPKLITTIPTIDPAVAISTSALEYIIDTDDKVITIPNTDTTINFLNYINIVGSATKNLYTDSTLTTLAGTDVHNGMVLEVGAMDGTTSIKEYYTVKIENEISLIKVSSYSFNNTTLQISNVLQGMTLNEFLNNIEVHGEAQKVLLESDGETTVTGTSIQGGMKLKIVSESGYSESVYTIATVPVILGQIQTTIDGQPTDILTIGNTSASVAVQSYRPVVLILAKYWNNQLLDCKLASHLGNSINPAETLSASFDVDSIDGVTVKAMVWDGIGGQQPLCAPKLLVPASQE